MKISVVPRLNKKVLSGFNGIFLPIFLKPKNKFEYGKIFDLLEAADRKLIEGQLGRRQPKDGESRFLPVSKNKNIYIHAFESVEPKKIALAVRAFTRVAKHEKITNILIVLDDLAKNVPATELAELISIEGLLAHYDFAEHFKTSPKNGWSQVKNLAIATVEDARVIRVAVKRGVVIGEAVNQARTLSNCPPGEMTPEGLAEAAHDLGRQYPELQVTVFNENRLEAMGMNAILSVGRGSANPPRLITLEYRGAAENALKLALVGKGITFDSGGLNIKPADGMTDMHLDMSGGAAVLSAMGAIAALNLPINVFGAIAAAENMPSGLSYRQGDIIKSFSGKTIEIGNTDAEGRVVLADAIAYAKTKNPVLLVTLATLTGAAVVALGTRMSALFVKDNQKLEDAFRRLGDEALEKLWPLPVFEEHESDVEGVFADVTNTNKHHSRYGGALTGAAFLSHFAKPLPFVHVDMAPRMLANPEEDCLSKGSVGFGVRLFVRLAERWGEICKTLELEK